MRSIKSRGGLTGGRGMTESIRHMWVLSFSHEEIGKSRIKQDYQDCLKFYDWLFLRNPFHIPDENLHSLSSGMMSIRGKDDVNCERAEDVGNDIQAALDNISYNSASMKRKDQVKTLASLQHSNTESTSGDAVVDSRAMFNRMITVAEREDNIGDFFEHELTQEPMSLFKNGMTRKPHKPLQISKKKKLHKHICNYIKISA